MEPDSPLQSSGAAPRKGCGCLLPIILGVAAVFFFKLMTKGPQVTQPGTMPDVPLPPAVPKADGARPPIPGPGNQPPSPNFPGIENIKLPPLPGESENPQARPNPSRPKAPTPPPAPPPPSPTAPRIPQQPAGKPANADGWTVDGIQKTPSPPPSTPAGSGQTPAKPGEAGWKIEVK